jgi:NRAMP (natural resistance-associated macrophage protein)-like metal ion transporter
MNRTEPPQPPGEVIPANQLGAREAACAQAPNRWIRFLQVLGPGIIVGASDDDPSGVATYAVAGATLGFTTLWTALVTLPMMASVQYIAARVGLVAGQGLGTLLRRHYPPQLGIALAFALAIANSINAGADIGAIGAAINLVNPHIPIIAVIVPVGALLLALQMWGSYRLISSTFKWLALALFAYIAAAFFAHPHWTDVLRGTFIPRIHFTASYITTLVAILGTTISPYMIFWQASQEVEEDIALGRITLRQRQGTTKRELRYAAVDVCAGMIFSNTVMYFIMLTTGATLFVSGHHTIATAADAAQALVPLAGPNAALLLAVGMIGVGALAVPILTASSAYALAGAYGWREGLSLNPARAPQFYGIIAVSTLIGMEINFVGISPVASLYWSAVLNGILAPLLLAVLMHVSNNKAIMGKETNNHLLNWLGGITTAVMGAAAIAFFIFQWH